jgi:hypothetical protein
VRVRAIAQVCTVSLGVLLQRQGVPCAEWQPVQLADAGSGAAALLPLALLLPAEATDGSKPLLLVRVPSPLPPTFLRHIRLLDHLVPRTQIVQWAAVAVYRVQLRAATCAAGIPAPCYAAVLLDVPL